MLMLSALYSSTTFGQKGDTLEIQRDKKYYI